MNWRTIAKYALALFLLRFTLGVLEGYFAKDLESPAILGWLASFVATAACFARLSIHQPSRTISHALLVLALEQVFGFISSFLLLRAIPQLDNDYPLPLLIVDYAGLAGALIVGMVIGTGIRRRRTGGPGPGPVPHSGPST